MKSSWILVLVAYLPQACAFVAGGVTLRTNNACSPRASSICTTQTRMAVGNEQEEAQTRAGVIKTMWRTALTAGAAQVLVGSPVFAADESVTESGLKIKKLVSGKGPTVSPGDLIGVRFKGTYGTYEFDNIFNSAEPYYMRAGVGTLVKGVEEAILMMHVGDRWELKCPADLAFGNKGRPPSPGRPRIPPGAEVEYTVELVSLPGKEEDILDILDEPLTGPAFDSA